MDIPAGSGCPFRIKKARRLRRAVKTRLTIRVSVFVRESVPYKRTSCNTDVSSIVGITRCRPRDNNFIGLCVDVKLSNAMLETFAKYQMSDEDIALIQRETQGIVTKAVLMQKIRGSLSSIGRIALFIGGGIALYLLIRKFKEQ